MLDKFKFRLFKEVCRHVNKRKASVLVSEMAAKHMYKKSITKGAQALQLNQRVEPEFRKGFQLRPSSCLVRVHSRGSSPSPILPPAFCR